MTEIRLHNTRTRKKEVFEPLDPANVRMYVCGPTVYDRAHLGNARPVVVFDVLYRLLRHVYGPDHVTYVRNFTDVDDKINARAAESGRSIGDITAETTQWYLDDMAALGALEPTDMPRATQWVPQMVTMIETLIAKGHAYEAEGHVLFAVESHAEYGALSGRSIDDMIAGARVEVAPYKRNPMDFVLWKPSSDDLPGWESPWGRGRPGWHIECSAMAYELLGASFDIHGGGNDLMFPHHENEIAQSACAHPEGEFARYWLHNEMLQVEGKKMSKSLGNFFTVRDLLDQGVPGEVIRFVMLSTNYRKPMDWTEKKSKRAENKLKYWRRKTEHRVHGQVPDKFLGALADDLNTATALKILDDLAADGNWEDLKAAARLIGLLTPNTSRWEWKSHTVSTGRRQKTRQLSDVRDLRFDYFVAYDRFLALMKSNEELIAAGGVAAPFTQTKNFKKFRTLNVEFLRILRSFDLNDFQHFLEEAKEWRKIGNRYPKILNTVDEEVEVSLQTFLNAVEARIDKLAYQQEAARTKKNFARADEIKKKASELGFNLVSTPEGVKWRPVQ